MTREQKRNTRRAMQGYPKQKNSERTPLVIVPRPTYVDGGRVILQPGKIIIIIIVIMMIIQFLNYYLCHPTICSMSSSITDRHSQRESDGKYERKEGIPTVLTITLNFIYIYKELRMRAGCRRHTCSVKG